VDAWLPHRAAAVEPGRFVQAQLPLTPSHSDSNEREDMTWISRIWHYIADRPLV